MQIVSFTIWNVSTNEIEGSGKSAGKIHKPDGCEIWYGDELSSDTHIFHEGAPIERTSPRLKDQEQLAIDVNRERERRVENGKDFDGIWLTGSSRDQVNMLALKDTARDLAAAGIADPIIPFRDGNNVEHMLTAAQTVDLANAGKVYVSALYQASWALKAMEPIPQDVTDDAYWP